MNRVHRVVWSESRQAFVVTNEKAKPRGKPSSTRKAIASAVVMALAALASSSAMAVSTCPNTGGSAITINNVETAPCLLSIGDSLTVTNTGSISGVDPAVDVNGAAAASIDNSGTIAGTTIGIDIYNAGSVTGTITNNANGTISASSAGIRLATGSSVGNIVNNGTVAASGVGISLSSGSIAGSIVNSGTISGNGAALYVNGGSSVTGDITNNAGGTIIGSMGTESGTGLGIYVAGGSIGGSIVNSGTITGGIALTNSSTITGGITNNAGGLISRSGSSAVAVFLSGGSTVGSITNHGTISGNNVGIWLAGATGSSPGALPSSVTGNISNTGTVSGASAGIALTSGSTAGGIVNSGTISGNIAALYVNGGSVTGGITNNAGGTIIGRTGTESGTGLGIYVAGGSIGGSIVNSGTITGGIELTSNSTVTGGITNNLGGSISRSGSSAAAIHLSSGSTVGSITNHGTISSDGIGICLAGAPTPSLGVLPSSVTGSITNSGTISGGRTGILVDGTSTVGSISNAGTINGGSGPAINILGTVSSGITNTGVINGDVVLNAATLNLDGTTGSISGAVTGSAGSAVNVNGTFNSANTFAVDSFNIANGGQLNLGNGVTATTGFNNAGTLSVAETGNVAITGNYTQDANGTYRVGAASNTVYGKLNVTGTATLPAAAKIDVNVNSINTLAPGNTLAGILTAGTLSASTFAVTDNSALLDFTGVVNGNAVDLTVKSVVSVLDSVIASGNTPAIGAATALDGLIAAAPGGDMGNVITALGKLPTQQDVSGAVTQTLPLLTGGMPQFNFNRLHGINQVIQARQQRNNGLSSGDGFVSNRHGWVKPIGSWADQKNRNAAFGYGAQTYGLVAGADKELSQTARLGAAFAYTQSTVDSNSAAQTAKVDSYLAILYGSHSLNEKTELNWQADYGHNRNKANRYIALLGRLALANYTSSSLHLGAGLGRMMALSPRTTFIPSVRADYTSIRENGYTETGAGALNLVVNGKTTDELILAVDGKVAHALTDSTTLTANLGIGYDTRAKQSSITSSFVGGGAAFTTAGINPSSTLVRGGLGIATTTSNATEITARYNVEARSGFTGQTFAVKLRMPF